MKSLFGTDGIRGEAGQFPLDVATVTVIGHSLARHLSNTLGTPPVIVIGRDTRESGEWIEKALIAGAIGAGATCRSAGVVTTPGVAFLTRSLQASAGVVISASHNPYHDNGIKIFSTTGQKVADSVERIIEQDIARSADVIAAAGDASHLSTIETQAELREKYLSFLVEDIARGFSLGGLKIVVDCANGASSQLAPALFERLGAEVVAINATPDGRNINLNSGSLHLESLQTKVVAEHADLGVAFDGDADRALFVDCDGKVVDGDATLWLLANFLQASGKLNDDTVVATVMSNIGLEIALRSKNIKLIRTDVGDKYVLDELMKLGASLGGEQSGHIILPELSLAGDGMITAIGVVRALRESRKALKDMTLGFEHYPQVLVNVRVREKLPLLELPQVRIAVDEVEERLSHNGRLLLRYSGTEPLARVMIEGQRQSEIEAYAAGIARAIESEIGAKKR